MEMQNIKDVNLLALEGILYFTFGYTFLEIETLFFVEKIKSDKETLNEWMLLNKKMIDIFLQTHETKKDMATTQSEIETILRNLHAAGYQEGCMDIAERLRCHEPTSRTINWPEVIPYFQPLRF